MTDNTKKKATYETIDAQTKICNRVTALEWLVQNLLSWSLRIYEDSKGLDQPAYPGSVQGFYRLLTLDTISINGFDCVGV